MPKFNLNSIKSNMGGQPSVPDLGGGLLNAESRAMLDGDLNIVYIPVNMLHVAEFNTYSVDDGSIEDLADSIADVGLLENLTVIEDENGYAILSGQRRFNAIQKLIEDGRLAADYKVPCDVKDLNKVKLTDADLDNETKALYITATSNETRNMTPGDTMLLVAQLTKVYNTIKSLGGKDRIGNRKGFIADSLKISPRQAQRVLNVNEHGSEDLKEAVSTGAVSIKVADALSSLDEEVQDELLEAAGVNELEEGETANLTVDDVQEFKEAAQKRTREKVKNKVRGQTVTFDTNSISCVLGNEDCHTYAVMLHGHTISQKAVDDIEGLNAQIEKLFTRLRKLLEKEVKDHIDEVDDELVNHVEEPGVVQLEPEEIF